MTFTAVKIKQATGNFLFILLILAIVLDPTNSVIHLKDVFFVLLVGYNMAFFRPDWKYLPNICLPVVGILCGYLSAEIQGNAVELEHLVAILKSVSPMILLLWIKYYRLLWLSYVPSVIACLMVLTLYVLASTSEQLEAGMYAFFASHDAMIMMTHRYIAGIKIFGMYLKSFVDMTFALFMSCYYVFYSQKRSNRIGFLLLAILFLFAFLISGTRSTMLLPFFMLGFVIFLSVYHTKKAKYLVFPLVLLVLVFSVGLFVFLVSDVDEESNVIKYGHLFSYMELFSQHPQYLFFGQGPATYFYSMGFRRMTIETEWTYIEMVRTYGLFCLFILLPIFYPLVRIFKFSKGNSFAFGVGGAYLSYLLIAGTNPLLISSTGMLMILTSYSYIEELQKTTNELEQK